MKQKQKQKHKDRDMPNRQSNMEPAEGSRESVLGDRDAFEHGSGTSELARGMSTEHESSAGGRSKGGGITNRGIDKEQEEQSHVPDRGDSGSER